MVCRYIERNALRAGLVKRAERWQYGSLWRWLEKPAPKPDLLFAWPIPRLPNWVKRVNAALSDSELEGIRKCVQRGRPLGTDEWVGDMVKKLKLESTVRDRGRPRKLS